MAEKTADPGPKAIDLSKRHCKPCEGKVKPLKPVNVKQSLAKVPGWTLGRGTGEHDWDEIARMFTFLNFYQTMAFVNAVAWIANSEGHHPDLEVGFKTCRVRYSTHAIKGLSENDFICAAKVDKLVEKRER